MVCYKVLEVSLDRKPMDKWARYDCGTEETRRGLANRRATAVRTS
jgi:hypothetical protein